MKIEFARVTVRGGIHDEELGEGEEGGEDSAHGGGGGRAADSIDDDDEFMTVLYFLSEPLPPTNTIAATNETS